MPSILDLMSKEDKEKALARGKKRLEKKEKQDVSPELYIVAELAYYLGMDAVLAIKRGYIINYDDDGKIIKEPFTLEEALALLEALRKVWYSKLVESSRGTLVATNSAHSKTPDSSFNTGIKPFKDKSDI